MIALTIYKLLLSLYPVDFRSRFSAEMLAVFQQRAGERFADEESSPVAFLVFEYSGALKGAYTMWTRKLVAMPYSPSAYNADESLLTRDELSAHRETALKNMVAAIFDTIS